MNDEQTVATVRQVYYEVAERDKADALVEVIEREEPTSAIIFCHTQVAVDRVTRQMQRHSPIGYVRVIESRFERLIFNQQALPRPKLAMRVPQPLFKPSLSLSDVRRTRVVRPVREPHGNIARPQAASAFNAVLHMLERAFPDSRVWITERAILILLILKKVRIDRSTLPGDGNQP